MPKVRQIGGLPVFCAQLSQYDPGLVAAWTQGVRSPGYKAQIEICRLLGCQMAELRSELGKAHSPFAELLVKKIVPYGKSGNFAKKTGLPRSACQKWIAGGSIPANRFALQSVRDALIVWGDKTPPDDLMAELSIAVEETITARKSKSKIAA